MGVIQKSNDNQPEDLVRSIEPTKVVINLGAYQVIIIIRVNKPIETNFNLAKIIFNKNDPNEFAKFQIDEIIFHEN